MEFSMLFFKIAGDKVNTKGEISFSRGGNQINMVDNEIKGRNFI